MPTCIANLSIDINKFRSDVYALMNQAIKNNPSKASIVTDHVLACLVTAGSHGEAGHENPA